MSKFTQKIGVLGGMGPESTVLFYQNLIEQCQQQYGAQLDDDYPEIFIYNLPIPDIVKNISQPEKTTQMLIQAAQKLEQIGATLLTMPCNTAHYFYPQLINTIQTPFLNIFAETAKKIKVLNFTKVGFLATTSTIKHQAFGNNFSNENIELIFPTNQKTITQIIFNILAGKKLQSDKQKLQKICTQLKQCGAQAIILACTDLPIILKRSDIQLPLLDTIQILAESAITTLNHYSSNTISLPAAG